MYPVCLSVSLYIRPSVIWLRFTRHWRAVETSNLAKMRPRIRETGRANYRSDGQSHWWERKRTKLLWSNVSARFSIKAIMWSCEWQKQKYKRHQIFIFLIQRDEQNMKLLLVFNNDYIVYVTVKIWQLVRAVSSNKMYLVFLFFV